MTMNTRIKPVTPGAHAAQWAEAEHADLIETLLQAPARSETGHGGPLPAGLAQRVQQGLAAEAAFVNVRQRRVGAVEPAPGVSIRTYYGAPQPAALRPGEPLRALWVVLQPGTRWSGAEARAQLGLDDTGHHREVVVLQGSLSVGDTSGDHAMHRLDSLILGDGVACPGGEWASATGATLFVRIASMPGTRMVQPLLVRDADAGWPAFADKIRRRVLFSHDGHATMLYQVDAGAMVPLHGHDHDEGCLMVEGDLFLDDVLLRAGDYQLAPVGTHHHTTATDTGCLLYVHGDLDLQFVEQAAP
jgi:quercetin dioxygenase-like cupin family protein